MERTNLKCANCGGNDFTVSEKLVPSGYSLFCNCCGSDTPLFLLGGKRSFIPINNKSTSDLFDQSYTREISLSDVYSAYKSEVE